MIALVRPYTQEEQALMALKPMRWDVKSIYWGGSSFPNLGSWMTPTGRFPTLPSLDHWITQRDEYSKGFKTNVFKPPTKKEMDRLFLGDWADTLPYQEAEADLSRIEVRAVAEMGRRYQMEIEKQDNPPYLTIMAGIGCYMVALMEYNYRQEEYRITKQSPSMTERRSAETWCQAWAEREGLEIR